MRFSTALVFIGAAASTSASLLARQNPPECVITCIGKANFGTCTPDNTLCLCQNADFVSSVTDCINTECPAADREAAFATSQAACSAVGVTLTSTPPAPTSTAPSGSSTGTPAASTTGTATGTTGTPAATTNAASSDGVSALAALAAVGLSFLAL